MNSLFSTAYFPPVAFWSAWIHSSKAQIEAQENYPKQSYRNRCVIAAANGPLPLNIPVKKGISTKIPISEVQIDYTENWQKVHFKALEAAYRSAPFFDFLMPELAIFFLERNFQFLLDFNAAIIQQVLVSMDWTVCELSPTKTYQKDIQKGIDFREKIHPKRPEQLEELFQFKPYYQVFQAKWGFLPNLSILDLVFNLGPEAEVYLLGCFQQKQVDKIRE